MKKTFSIVYRDSNGHWLTKGTDATSDIKTYRNKSEAVLEARKIARRGSTVIIHGVDGKVKEVIGVREHEKAHIKEAPVKHRMSNHDVNIAIAKVLEENQDKDSPRAIGV